MKNIIIIIFTCLTFAAHAQTPNSLGGVVVNKGVEDFTGTASAQVDSFIVELVDGTLLKVAKPMKVKLSNGAPVGTAIADVWIDTLGVDTMYLNNNGTWVRFTVGSSATTTLDDVYNNFGATPSKITVDAAQGQTGGLEIETGSDANVIIDLQGNSRFIVQDGGAADVFNIDGNLGEIRLVNNTDNGTQQFQVNGTSFFAGNMDIFANIRDNRGNTFLSQSSSATTSNRLATFGNSTYSDMRFVSKRLLFDPGHAFTMSGTYGYFFELPTSTSGNTATYIFKKTGSAAVSSSANGGDWLVEFGAGDGIGRQGRMGIGLGNTAANPTVSTPRRMLDVGGNVSIRGDIYNPGDSTGTVGQFPVKRGTGWGWASTSSALDINYFKQGGNSFATAATIGPNDAFSFNLKTKNIVAVTIDTLQNISANNNNVSEVDTLESATIVNAGNPVVSSSFNVVMVAASANDTLLNTGADFGYFSNVPTVNGNVYTISYTFEVAFNSVSANSNTFSIPLSALGIDFGTGEEAFVIGTGTVQPETVSAESVDIKVIGVDANVTTEEIVVYTYNPALLGANNRARIDIICQTVKQ